MSGRMIASDSRDAPLTAEEVDLVEKHLRRLNTEEFAAVVADLWAA